MIKSILFFTHYSALYGANRSLIKILEICLKEDKELFVIMPKPGGLSRELQKMGVTWEIHKFKGWIGKESKISFSCIDNFRGNRNTNFNLKQIPKIKRKLGDFQPDLVCSNTSIFNIGFLYAQKYNKPHIWFVRSHPDHYSFKWFQKEYTQNSLKESEVVIAISHFLKEFLVKEFSLWNVKQLYNAILSERELENLDKRKRNHSLLDEKVFTFGIVGLIHPEKGQEIAVRAFANFHKLYPKSKLLIIGAGKQSGLKKIIRELNLLNNVVFTGHLNDPFEGFLRLDVSLVCSTNEGLGRVALESMALRIPVIGRDDGATSELINHGENGLLYSGGHEELFEKMVYLYKNEDKRIAMGELGRKFLETNFTNEVFSRKFLKVINKL
ncbi:glycosyltransferase family 4 protein [Salegentibacter sp. Hel_I_6]|uniref:glycosyltransferase family 4 protein n=1 Tax=Salegentibacter sp. Hel_I_6 TaxID=1250278 RepID=UPI00056D438D|nr:glycosyltransferase family 4 protein [Salegentibacter sp. Hel_I_6]